MSSSSIFSFDTLNLQGFKPKAMVAALLVLIAIELGVGRSEWIWSWIPASDSGVIDAMEDRIISQSHPPAIVMLGNSRLRDALMPRELEEALSLPRGSVHNLGMTVGTPFDSLTMYRRSRESFSDARILVLHLEAFNLAPMRPTERFRRFATLEERLSLPSRADRLSTLVGFFWRTFDAQKPLQQSLITILLRRDTTLRFSEDGRIDWRRFEEDSGPDFVDLSHYRRGFERFMPGKLGADYVRGLLRLAEADGLRVVVFRAPFRDAYADVSDAFPRREAHFRAFCDSLPVNVHCIILQRGSGLGLTPRDFYDYGHLTNHGAKSVTRYFAEELRREIPGAIAECR
jgi:hypothetical protein